MFQIFPHPNKKNEKLKFVNGSFQNIDDGSEKLKVLEDSSDGFVIADADLKIRGPGEMLGKAQSGLDGLKLGDLISDTDLVRKAQALAANLISEDPLLKNPKNQSLRLLVDNIGQNNDLIA